MILHAAFRRINLDNARTFEYSRFMACRTVTKRGKQIRGTFQACRVAPKRSIAPGSLRWKGSGDAWLQTGCPKGKWRSRKKVCTVGTKLVEILRPTGRGAALAGIDQTSLFRDGNASWTPDKRKASSSGKL